MELKILILDDEYIILDGLCSFPWEMYGCKGSVAHHNSDIYADTLIRMI